MDAVYSGTKVCCGEEFRVNGIVSECQKEIIDIARTWIGTPFKSQSSVKGSGCDCVGLVRGVWREFYGKEEPEKLPPYQPYWFEIDHRDPLLNFGRRYLVDAPIDKIMPSDVLVFRMREGASAKHCGIVTSADSMIHAYFGQAVFEVSLGNHWYRKIAAVLRFPCKEDS